MTSFTTTSSSPSPPLISSTRRYRYNSFHNNSNFSFPPPSRRFPRLHLQPQRKPSLLCAKNGRFRRPACGVASSPVLDSGCGHSVSCFRRHRRRLPSSCFFLDKSSSSLFCKNKNGFGKNPQICCALGPDEPHVASTYSDASLEKQGLPFWDGEMGKGELEAFLQSPLPNHPKLHRGQLKNGLRYLILPNKVPVNRFEAHLEVHAGSIDEEDDEQGIAHMIEHVAFLGSKKREKLLGTGARSNAYTDFHHTVFHIHSLTSTQDSGEDLLPCVLDALNEIAFHPKFLSSRVEKERRAILSELQMMNTIEYRIDCQLLQHLHSENKLSKRFPIGLEEQIQKWDPDKIQKFHERWYFPANATLYLVGDITDIPKTVYQIEAVFGRVASEKAATVPTQNTFGAMASFLVPKLPVGLGGSPADEKLSISFDQPNLVRRQRQAVRPPVEHKWSLPGLGDHAKPPEIFQHELVQNFSVNMFCKIPVSQVRTYGDLRDVLMKRIFLSALHFRINSRYKSSSPPFTTIELDHSDSGREGCTVTTLTVTAEPKNWQGAIKVAVHEVRRLKEFGVTKGELTRYMDALIKDSEQLAAMMDSVPSVDNLEFIMESDALGHTVMDQMQGYHSLVAIAETVTLEEVNSTGSKVLEFISDFGQPTAPLPAAIVACVPSKVHIEGVGETNFSIYPHEITDAIKSGLEQPIEAEPELEVPKELISPSQLMDLRLEKEPHFIPLSKDTSITKLYDKEAGVTQRRLSNGIAVNYKITKNEAKVGVMRLIVGGGRATENSGTKGAVVVGVRTLSEGGCVGNFSREQVELFCVNHLINCSLESTEEFIAMEFRFTLRNNAMRAAFELLHMVLEHSVWREDAFDRARQLYLSFYRSIPKSLERSTARKLMVAMLNGDERFVEPTPESLQMLTLETVKESVMNQFFGENMEVSIVGDFTEAEIEACILDYLGTVSAKKGADIEQIEPIVFRPSPSDLHFQQVYLKDTDERACAYIAGPAPNRWGLNVDGKDLLELIKASNDEKLMSEKLTVLGNKDEGNNLKSGIRGHPLFFGITLGLLSEIINSRLFTTVRDSLGLSYDVSFELSLFDRLNLGWYVISVTSTPEKVYKAVDASKNVLRGLHSQKIAQRELDRAKRTLLMRHEAEAKTNAYWLGLLAHLQASSVPRKDISCINELTSLYEAATIEDIYVAYQHLKIDDASLFSCIGVAGATAGEDSPDPEDDLLDGIHNGLLPGGRGLSTMTRPTT